MKMTGAMSLLKILEEQNVRVIFGYPGGAVLPIYDALLETPGIRHVLVRGEQAAAHAASGYARITGRAGVCLATSGPGATNLVTGIANAYMDSTPLVAITGQVSTSMIGTDAFQEVDITGITMPITKHNYLVKNVKELPRVIAEAFHIANTGRPGPVLVDIPRDVAEAMVEYEGPPQVNLKGYKPTYKGHSTQIRKMAKMIQSAKKPAILAGGGIMFSGASGELMEFARKVQAPVATTLNGLGVYPETDELALGMMGMHGRPAANYAMSNCDLMISLGVRFGDRATGTLNKFARNCRVIHVDIDPAEIGKNVPVDLPIVGDIRQILQEVLQYLEPRDNSEWLAQVMDWKEKHPMRGQYGRGDNLKPQRVISTLGDLTGHSAVVATDVGQHQMWSAQYYGYDRPRSFVSSGGLGTMGYGLPAAIGAQMADPDALVCCITGDGSFQMNLTEMATAMEQCLPIKIILMNNSSLSLVKQLQHFQCDQRYSGIDFTANPDFGVLARAYGVEHLRIETNEEIEPVLKEALGNGKMTLVECMVSNREMVFPIVQGKQGLDEMIKYEIGKGGR